MMDAVAKLGLLGAVLLLLSVWFLRRFRQPRTMSLLAAPAATPSYPPPAPDAERAINTMLADDFQAFLNAMQALRLTTCANQLQAVATLNDRFDNIVGRLAEAIVHGGCVLIVPQAEAADCRLQYADDVLLEHIPRQLISSLLRPQQRPQMRGIEGDAETVWYGIG